MKESTYRLIVIVLALIIVIGGCVLIWQHFFMEDPTQAEKETVSGTKESEPDSTEPESENAAPDFTVYDMDGNAVSLSDFRGKPVILNFWASWCGPCKAEMPDFDEAYQEYGDRIQFVMVNLTDGSNETIESASALIAQQGYSFPVYYDTDMNASGAYSVYSIPMTCLINEKGELLDINIGMMSADELEAAIETILPE